MDEGRSDLVAETTVAKGLPREGVEPITMSPGRWNATSRDVGQIIADFQQLLSTEPKVGAFPKFRGLFKTSGASKLLARKEREVARDVFQFVSGVCWLNFVNKDLVSKVGVIFLLYLLFHSQRQQHPIPITVELLQELVVLRDHCVARGIFLELPAIVGQMVQQDMFSVGLHATCRNFWFDQRGRLIERGATGSPRGSTEEVLVSTGPSEISAPRQSATNSNDGETNRCGEVVDPGLTQAPATANSTEPPLEGRRKKSRLRRLIYEEDETLQGT